jgi:hypothetical protein
MLWALFYFLQNGENFATKENAAKAPPFAHIVPPHGHNVLPYGMHIVQVKVIYYFLIVQNLWVYFHCKWARPLFWWVTHYCGGCLPASPLQETKHFH